MLVVAASLVAWAAPARVQTLPEPPRVFMDTTWAPPTGGTRLSVPAGGNLQAALDAARPGDVIELAAGATFTGNFVLPNKGTAAGWIYVRSSAWRQLPAAGTRVSPAHAALMARIVTPNEDAALFTAPGAHHYRLTGIEITATTAGVTNFGLIRLDGATYGDVFVPQTTGAQVPHDLVIDRCYIHGAPAEEHLHGVVLQSAHTAIIDSYLADFQSETADTQAIVGWNGPGPFKIVNNELQAAGENVMFGGATADIPNLVPSDIEIRRNHFFKPLRWRVGDPSFAGIVWAIKSHLEFKNAQRVLVEGNLFENNWPGAQSGHFLLITPRAEDGSMPWAFTGDITIRSNLVRRTTNALAISGTDGASRISSRVLVRNNLFEDVGAYAVDGAPEGQFASVTNRITDLTIDHNTVLHTGTILSLAGESPDPGFSFTNNIVSVNDFGIVGDGIGLGAAALDFYTPDRTTVGNVIAGPWPSAGGATIDMFPPNNFYPRAIADVGFVDAGAGNYALLPSSPYKNAATDGTDVGIDAAALAAALIGPVAVAPTETCVIVDFREITLFRDGKVLTSSDAAIRARAGLRGGFDPSLWPYDPFGRGDATASRAPRFRIYGFDAAQVGTAIPDADDSTRRYPVMADPAIAGAYFIDLGGPARAIVCISQLQDHLIDAASGHVASRPGSGVLTDAQRNVPGIMLTHNAATIDIPLPVREDLRALGTPLVDAHGRPANAGVVDYLGFQLWGRGSHRYSKFVDVQIEFLFDDPANLADHYAFGFLTVKNGSFETFAGCHYLDRAPGNDGIRFNDVWSRRHTGDPNYGAACGTREPRGNQKLRETDAVPFGAVQLLPTVNSGDDTVRIFFGAIRAIDAVAPPPTSRRR